MATVKTYDQRCYDLAEAFLSDEPDHLNTKPNIHAIALEIQQCIEDEISFLRHQLALTSTNSKPHCIHGLADYDICPDCAPFPRPDGGGAT